MIRPEAPARIRIEDGLWHHNAAGTSDALNGSKRVGYEVHPMDEVSFYAGLALLVIGLCGLLFGHRVTTDESAIEFAGRSRVPAFVVMSFGVVLMLISTRFPSRISKSHEVREFSQPGGMANFPCESHDTSHVIYRAPTGLKIVDAQADTRDVVSTKRSSA